MIGQLKHPGLGAIKDTAPAHGGVYNTYSDFTSPALLVTPSSSADFSADSSSSSSSSSLSFLDRVYAHITPHPQIGDRDGMRPVSSLTSGHIDCLRDSTSPEQWTTTKHSKVHKVFVEKNCDSYLPPYLDATFVSTILAIQQPILGALAVCNFFQLPHCAFSLTATSIVIAALDCIQAEVDKILQSGAVPDYAVHILLDIPFFGSYIHHDNEVQLSGLICVQYYRTPWTGSAKWHRRSDLHIKDGLWFMAAAPKDKYHFKEPLSTDLTTETRDIQPPATPAASFIAIHDPITEPAIALIDVDTLMQQNTERLDTSFASNSDSAVQATEPANLPDMSTSTTTFGLGITNTDIHSLFVQRSIGAPLMHCGTSWQPPVDSLSLVDQSFLQHRPQRQRKESSSSNFSNQGSQLSYGDPLTSAELTAPEDPPDNPLSSPAIIASNLEALSMATPNPNQTPQAPNDNAPQQPSNNPGLSRPFFCKAEGCPKFYARKANLDEHFLTHDTANRFACPSCPQTFSRERDRDRHKGVVHDGWRWECQFCLKVFTRQETAKKHTCRVTKGRSPNFQLKQFFAPPNNNDNNDNDNSGNTNNN